MSDNISLSSIFNLVKSLGDRISVIEEANGRVNKRRSPDYDTEEPPMGPNKRLRHESMATSCTNVTNYAKPGNTSTGNVQFQHPVGSVMVGNSLSNPQSRVRQLVPSQGEPSAAVFENRETTEVPDETHPLVINAVITEDFSNLENCSNVDLDELEQRVLEDAGSECSSDHSNQIVNNNQPIPDTNANANAPALPILGNNSAQNWTISDETLAWFRQVADLDLHEDEISEIDQAFNPSEEIKKDFIPPDIPSALWNKMKSNNAEYYKQKALLRTQKLNCMALKPLLSVIEKLDKSDQNIPMLTSAIQLMCCANLQLGKTRRSATAKFVRNDLRSSLFSNPVSHLNLFGMEFDSATEQAVKSSNALQKVLVSKKPYNKPPISINNPKPFTPQSSANPLPGPSTSAPRQPSDRNQFFRKRGTGRVSYSTRYRNQRK